MLKRKARSVYAGLMAWKPLGDFAWKSAYLGKFLQWSKEHPCREFRGGYHEAREELYQYVSRIGGLQRPIHYLEFGVYRGDSLRWWLSNNKEPDSRFVGFDSFEGLPENWRTDRPKGYFSTGGKVPEVDDPRCSFQVGWFHETLPRFAGEFCFDKPSVVHLDADLYSSTLLVLGTLAPKLKR